VNISIISEVVTVLCLPGRGATQMEKSPRFYWTIFLTVAYAGAYSLNNLFKIAWFAVGALPCRKNTLWQLTFRCCWNRACRLTCFLSASLRKNELQFGTWTDPLSKKTVDSVLRYRELGRAKDISATLVEYSILRDNCEGIL